MAPALLSRKLTLADLLLHLKVADLPERRRQDMASAARTAARVLGREPANLPADPHSLARWLDAAAPLAHGLSAVSWNNTRSLLRAGLALQGPVLKGRSKTPLLPDWLNLFERLANDSERMRLGRLLRWLSEREIDPATVSLTDLDAFRLELFEQSLIREPGKTWTSIRATWNRAVRSVSGFPDLTIDVPKRVDGYLMDWSAFPASLQADLNAWLDRLAGRDLGEDGPLRAVRPSTLQTRAYQLQGFASALARSGVDPATLRSLADLVAYDMLVVGLRFYRDRQGGLTQTIHGLASMLKSVARHWAKADEAQLLLISKLMGRLAVPDPGMTAKNRTRLRLFNDDAHVAALLTLPLRLQKEAAAKKIPRYQAAVLASLAVAIELLIVAPIRRQNLASVDIARHMVRIGRRTYLILPSDEVKNSVDLEFELPKRTVDLIDWYLAQHWPVLAAAGSTALFPGRKAEAKSGDTLGRQIVKVVFKYTGLRVNTHLFRHIGAKIFLDAEPGSYEVIRRVLGHKRMDTTTKYYTGLESGAAARHFDEVIFKSQARAEARVALRPRGVRP